MQALIVIPARLGATRFPNKPLHLINGKPMIQHVWERAMQANVGPVVVACGEEALVDVVKGFGGAAVLTNPDLPSGTDRVYAGYCQYMIENPQATVDVIVNLQGDLPFFPPAMLARVLTPLHHKEMDFATLCGLLHDQTKLADHGTVTVALAGQGTEKLRALYFSRSAIPHGASIYYHHFGVYAYRPDVLKRFVNTPPSPLEKAESLEQLRALEQGFLCGVAIIEGEMLEVNVPDDIPPILDRLAAA